MNKTELVQIVVRKLSAELALNLQAARAAAAGATDEQNKAESKYDTRGLELSYLAAGQGRQIAEAEATIEQFRTLGLRDFSPESPIDISALVTLEIKGQPAKERPVYFLTPRGGGTEVLCSGSEVVVITPQSPLGRELMGRRVGGIFSFGKPPAEHRIVKVS